MRRPRYLSPTSISKFYEDRDEFYLNYLADNRPPRYPQTEPMAVGSAFDAYIKTYLTECLFGVGEAFDFDEIFTAQVEPQNRDFALVAGRVCFDAYKCSGMLASLMKELADATSRPRFEFTVEDRVSYSSCIDGIPFLGKPDVYYQTDEGSIVIDWKVNGYCGSRNVSPAPGYIMCRDGWDTLGGTPHSRSHGKAHKLASGRMVNGCFSTVHKGWADQVCIYAWLLGEEVGDNFIIGIDQLACDGSKRLGSGAPLIRVAAHRGNISPSYQEQLYGRALYVWTHIEHATDVFDYMSEDEALAHAASLDGLYAMYSEDTVLTEGEAWMRDSML